MTAPIIKNTDRFSGFKIVINSEDSFDRYYVAERHLPATMDQIHQLWKTQGEYIKEGLSVFAVIK